MGSRFGRSAWGRGQRRQTGAAAGRRAGLAAAGAPARLREAPAPDTGDRCGWRAPLTPLDDHESPWRATAHQRTNVTNPGRYEPHGAVWLPQAVIDSATTQHRVTSGRAPPTCYARFRPESPACPSADRSGAP